MDLKLKVAELAMKTCIRNDGREYTVNEKLVHDQTVCAAYRM